MRFTEFSIPESTQWMEKSDILFLLDCCSGETPFISKSIIEDYERVTDSPYNVLIDRIHPDDLYEFKKIIEGRSARPAHHKLRILDRTNHIQLFSFHKLKIGNGRKKDMLLGISKKRYKEPILTPMPISW